jgi:hypothetical protein
MKKGKQMIAGLLLFAFIGLISISILFSISSPKEEIIETIMKESFADPPPTRASECNCIPGYIPSNMTINKKGTIHQTKDNVSGNYIYYYMPIDSTNLYIINLNNTCGLKLKPSDRTINSNNYPQVVNYAGNMGQLTCDLVKKEKNSTSAYFCQNLTDPNLRAQCYKA